MTNDCLHIQPDLKAYADHELSWPRHLIVRRHVTHCAACRKELTAMSQIADELRIAEAADTALDPALRAKLIANVPTSSLPAPPELGAGGRSFRLPSAWHLAAAGAIVLVMWAILFPVLSISREKARNISAATSAGAATAELAPDRQDYVGRSLAPRVSDLQANSMAPSPTDTLTRQVHNEATLTVQVADAEAGSDQVAQIVKGADGFVAGNTLSTGDDGIRGADLTVKVPVVQFETVLSQLTKLGQVQAKNITGEDITEKTSDADQAEGVLEDEVHQTDTRLKTLGKKAGWDDQQNAQNTRIQLAQVRARLLLLHKMAALSTISIHLSEKPKPVATAPVTNGFWNGLGDSTHAATSALLTSMAALLSVIIWLLAFAPLWLPLALIGRYTYRRYRQAT